MKNTKKMFAFMVAVLLTMSFAVSVTNAGGGKVQHNVQTQELQPTSTPVGLKGL